MPKEPLSTAVQLAINGQIQEAAGVLDAAGVWDLGSLPLALLAGGQSKLHEAMTQLQQQYAVKGQLNLAAMLSIAMHNPLQAIEYYRSAGCPREALAVASTTLLLDDRITLQLRQQYAASLTSAAAAAGLPAPPRTAAAAATPAAAACTKQPTAAAAAAAAPPGQGDGPATTALECTAAPAVYRQDAVRAAATPESTAAAASEQTTALGTAVTDSTAAAAAAAALPRTRAPPIPDISTFNAANPSTDSENKGLGAVAAANLLLLDQPAAAAKALASSSSLVAGPEVCLSLQAAARVAALAAPHKVGSEQLELCNMAAAYSLQAAAVADTTTQPHNPQQQQQQQQQVPVAVLQGLLSVLQQLQAAVGSQAAAAVKQPAAAAAGPAARLPISSVQQDALHKVSVVLLVLQLVLQLLTTVIQLAAAGNSSSDKPAPAAAAVVPPPPPVAGAVGSAESAQTLDQPTEAAAGSAACTGAQLIDAGKVAAAMDSLWQQQQVMLLDPVDSKCSSAQVLEQLQQQLPLGVAAKVGGHVIDGGIQQQQQQQQQHCHQQQLAQPQDQQMQDEHQQATAQSIGPCGLCVVAALLCWQQHFHGTLSASSSSSSTLHSPAWLAYWQQHVSGILENAYQQQLQLHAAAADARSAAARPDSTGFCHSSSKPQSHLNGTVRVTYSRQQLMFIKQQLNSWEQHQQWQQRTHEIRRLLAAARVPLSESD